MQIRCAAVLLRGRPVVNFQKCFVLLFLKERTVFVLCFFRDSVGNVPFLFVFILATKRCEQLFGFGISATGSVFMHTAHLGFGLVTRIPSHHLKLNGPFL